MPRRKFPDREEQIALMNQAPERIAGYISKWLADPEVKAALHRYDEADSAKLRKVKRAAFG